VSDAAPAPDLTSNLPTQLFLDGVYKDGSGGGASPMVFPGNEQVIAEVQKASPEDVNLAVAAARAAVDGGDWSRMGPQDRAKILYKIAETIRERSDELARLETLNTGKPLMEAKYVDVAEAANVFEYFAGWATKVTGQTMPDRPNTFQYTRREPVGVVGAITPWNFPIVLATWKVAPALATGNAIIVKPATLTPFSMLKVAEIAVECGLPAGVFSVLPGSGAVVGPALIEHPGIDKIAFTGSTEVGKGVGRACAEHVKRCTLELGGKSPNIVLADADLDAAVKGATIGIFYNKGEVCAAGSRLLVEDACHDAFMDKLISRTERMKPLDPFHPKSRLGPCVSKPQMESVLEYIEKGKAEGAKLVAGGDRAQGNEDGTGYYVNPTVFDDVDNATHAIAREEIFGPVLSVIRVKDEADAIRQGNDTFYGLAAGVWTSDIKKGLRVAHGLRAGTVWVNTYNQYDPAMPFGGYKQSGYGRELGSYALDAYTEVKSVWVDLSE
jgi:aldehyde dehydrogenase (NAD+)/phenylacetaldehyde dehydrogenase